MAESALCISTDHPPFRVYKDGPYCLPCLVRFHFREAPTATDAAAAEAIGCGARSVRRSLETLEEWERGKRHPAVRFVEIFPSEEGSE